MVVEWKDGDGRIWRSPPMVEYDPAIVKAAQRRAFEMMCEPPVLRELAENDDGLLEEVAPKR